MREQKRAWQERKEELLAAAHRQWRLTEEGRAREAGLESARRLDTELSKERVEVGIIWGGGGLYYLKCDWEVLFRVA